jgi:hypothetical protein
MLWWHQKACWLPMLVLLGCPTFWTDVPDSWQDCKRLPGAPTALSCFESATGSLSATLRTTNGLEVKTLENI